MGEEAISNPGAKEEAIIPAPSGTGMTCLDTDNKAIITKDTVRVNLLTMQCLLVILNLFQRILWLPSSLGAKINGRIFQLRFLSPCLAMTMSSADVQLVVIR